MRRPLANLSKAAGFLALILGAFASLLAALSSIAGDPPAGMDLGRGGGTPGKPPESAPGPSVARPVRSRHLRLPGWVTLVAWARRRRRLAIVLAVLAVFGIGVGLYAFFTAGATAGSGGQAVADALPTGNTPGTPTLSAGNVTVSWTQNSVSFAGGSLGANAKGGYLIKRYADNAPSTPITPSGTCAGATMTGVGTNIVQGGGAPLTCSDTSVPTGRWTYTVTPAFYLWRGPEGTKSAHVVVAPANPTSVALTNGAGAGNAFINTTNASSLNFNVVVPGTSLATDTITLTLTDVGAVHTVIATAAGTAGAGTVTFIGVNASSLNDGTITITAKASSSYGDNSAGTASQTRTKDTVGPTNALTLNTQSPAGSSFLTGSTVYYRGTGGGAGGSFKIQNAVSDGASGPASSATAALGGTTTGWSPAHVPSTVSTPPGGPYVSNVFTWTEGASSSPTEVVTGADSAGNTTPAPTLTFTNDSTAPTGGALTVNGQSASAGGTTGYNNTGSFSISRTEYTDAGSGLASSTLTREVAALTSTGIPDGGCGAFGTLTTITGSPTQDSGTLIATNNCYRYTLKGTDNVGNNVSIITIVKVDTSAPTTPAPTLSAATGTNTFISGTNVFINPQAGNSGSFQVADAPTDTQSGIQKVNFPALAGFTSGGGDDTTSLYSTTYNWSGAGATASGSQTLTAFNNAALQNTTSFTVTPDTTKPATTPSPSPAANAQGWNRANVTVTLSATDTGGSGVQKITYSESGAQTLVNTTYTVPFTISTQGTTTISYFATDNVGNVEATGTLVIKLDTAAPTSNTLALASQSGGGSFKSANTIFYQGSVAGDFAIQNTVADALSGPFSSTTAALGGTSTGWSHTASTVSTPSGGPFVSNTFHWASSTSTSPTEVVTGADAADNTLAAATLTFTNDSTAPAGGTLTINGGSTYATSTTVTVAHVNYTDGGSGLAAGSNVITRSSATLSNNSCGGFSGSVTVGGATDTVASGNCYQYTLAATDNVGNTTSVTFTLKVDTALPTGSVTAPTNGSTVGGTVAVSSSDAADTGGSALASVLFQVKPVASGSFTDINTADTTSPYSTNWDSTLVANGSYLLRAIITDNAGNATTTATITVTVSNSFTVSASTPQTAGSSFSVTITKKTAGVTDTSYTGSHTIVFTGPANAPNGQAPTYPATVNFTLGVGTATVTLFDAQTTTLTATEGNTTGTSSNIVVNAAAASVMKLSSCLVNGSSVSCAGPFLLGNGGGTMKANISLFDAWGNVPANTSLTINLTSDNTAQFSVTASVTVTSSTTSTQLTVTKIGNAAGTANITAHATSGPYSDLVWGVSK